MYLSCTRLEKKEKTDYSLPSWLNQHAFLFIWEKEGQSQILQFNFDCKQEYFNDILDIKLPCGK